MSRGALRAMFRPYVEFDFTRMAFDARVSFSRSSTGTYFDAAGVMQTATSNTPRKGHNPATGAVRGLLLEEQRTNLSVNSTGSTGSGDGTAIITAGSVVAPDGTTTADLLQPVNSSRYYSYYTYRIFASGVSGAITESAYIKPSAEIIAGGYIGIYTSSNDRGYCRCVFNAGVRTVTAGINTLSATVTPCQNGWFRVSATWLDSGGSRVRLAFIGGIANNTSASSFALWGRQVEAGSYPTSYIPTTTAAVTRAADVATFTIPPRVVRLVTIYDDGTTSQQTVTPGASYTIPTGQKPILRIRGYFA